MMKRQAGEFAEPGSLSSTFPTSSSLVGSGSPRGASTYRRPGLGAGESSDSGVAWTSLGRGSRADALKRVPSGPLVLGEDRATNFGQAVGRIDEHLQDRLAIGSREGDEILLGVQREKQHIGRVVEAGVEQEPSQIGDTLFADGNPGEPHSLDATRRREPEN
jgi:hypothetical protein